MKTTRNLYEVLGLATGADGAMVDQAYWHLAKSYQQLAPQDPRAEGLLDELNEAYGVLGTPRLREQYDLELRTGGGANGHGRLVATKATGKGRASHSIKLPKLRLPFLGRATRQPAEGAPSPTRAVIAASNRVAGRDQAHDLHASTSAMLQRWRNSAGIQPATEHVEPEPDMTLVDIFKTEHELETADEPLTSVMEILRRTRHTAQVE